MFIIEIQQFDGSYWGFRYGAITGEPARFETASAAKRAFIMWNDGKLSPRRWRVTAI